MSALALLLEHTPWLLGGFVWNLLISLLAMLFGTLLGGALGWLRDQPIWSLRAPAGVLTSVCRNVPSFVLLFYVAFVLPVEVVVADQVILLPLWLKAVLALTIPVIGFASDQTLGYRRQVRMRLASARAVFTLSWLQYFLIVLMASATASVIGADEVVGRANRVIAIDSSPGFLLLVYTWVCSWFLLAGLLLVRLRALLERGWRVQ
ncbi:ABC transporter permease [Halopseudomonas salegens]|uniref:Amino acid ABC transporter membrane protein 2, PAAT family n=1 Tax=Halopseudomonas salegens TaxID=1434072 RepID=A0A1H2EGX0_9GAMM|nr:hypothetical protein [Halopseudomonas salegens]SDT94386.1 amino acid ABC transporter membrane protein 2, PAAT family [Halopseudomonas salegens]